MPSYTRLSRKKPCLLTKLKRSHFEPIICHLVEKLKIACKSYSKEEYSLGTVKFGFVNIATFRLSKLGMFSRRYPKIPKVFKKKEFLIVVDALNSLLKFKS